jgi:hypothetical protein
MPRMLTKLRIDEVSSVDRGAGEGVKIMLMKRHKPTVFLDEATDDYLKRDYLAELEAQAKVEKREFSAKERQAAEESGAALPGGGFPILNKTDLKNAMRAVGRAKDPAAAKAHIKSRAKALGLEGELTDAFKRQGLLAKVLQLFAKDAETFDEAQGEIEAREFAGDMLEEFCEAFEALRCSINSILCDDEVIDKQALIEETLDQYRQHVQGVVPEEMEKAFAAAAALTAGGAGIRKEHKMAMTDEERKAKEKAEKDAEETKKLLLVAKREIAVLKMSDGHKAYMDHPDATMPSGGKEAFQDMEPGERDKHIEKHPIKKRELPEEVRKALAQAEDDRKILKALQEDKEIAAFAKRAAALGLPEAFGETLRKAAQGDAAAIGEIEKTLKGLTEQVRTGKVFAEFGSSAGTGGGALTAHDQLVQKAEELRKKQPELSPAQAFAKAYQDPANRELAKQERRENRPAAA